MSGAHATITLPDEYGKVPYVKAKKVMDEMTKNKSKVKFEITSLKVISHRERSGDEYWLACFEIGGKTMENLREKLKLGDRTNYYPHIVALELKI